MHCRNKDDIIAADLQANVLVFGGPREELDQREVEELKKWLSSGGRAMLLLSGATDGETHTNYGFLEE